jgi:spore maturation protein CgeB
MILCPSDYYDGDFEDKVNCVMYEDSAEDFAAKLEHYLENDAARNKIIDAAHSNILDSRYSWEGRIKKLLGFMEGIKNGKA